MKSTFYRLFAVFLLFGFGACEGPEGPPGPAGPAGPQGIQGPEGSPGPDAVVFEYENIDFQAPDFGIFLEFPDFQALPSDVILVYALWETQETDDSELFEIWRQLPQTVYLEEGRELVYNFNHTDVDVEVFLEGNFPIEEANLSPAYLNDWVIRVVIVPGHFLTNARGTSHTEFNDYSSVKKFYKLPDLPKPAPVQHRRPAVK